MSSPIGELVRYRTPMIHRHPLIYWLWPDSRVCGSTRRAPLGYALITSHFARTLTQHPIHHHSSIITPSLVLRFIISLFCYYSLFLLHTGHLRKTAILVHGPTEVPMHPPPMIHHEWYQIVQWTLGNDLSDVVTF